MNPNRLLIADDVPQIGSFVRRVGEGCGYEVRIVERAAQFLDAYRAFAPTVVMLDLTMPDADDTALLAILADEHSTAKILIMSGSAPEACDDAVEAGRARGLMMVGVVPKPVRLAALEAQLKTHRIEA